MRYLHIIPPSKRMMYGYMSMIEKYFDQNEHYYLSTSHFTSEDSALLLFENVTSISDLRKGKLHRFLHIRDEFRKADRIVFHSFSPDSKWLLLTYMLRKYLSKAVWVMWGIDLYNFKSSKKGFYGKLEDYMGITCRKLMRYPVAIAETDIEVYNRTFGCFPVTYAPYGFVNERFVQMETYLKARRQEITDFRGKLESGETEQYDAVIAAANRPAGQRIPECELAPYDGRIRVQIGHNGFRFNNHLQSLCALTKIMSSPQNSRIELVLPTSYGNSPLSKDSSYVNALRYHALARYPFNATFLTKLMSADQYTKFLSTVDVAIFNAARQNGLGNILQLLYMGKKIYMSSDNPLFCFLTEKGFILHDIKELETASFEEFIAPDKLQNPKMWISKNFGMESTAKLWRIVFDFAEGKIEYETVKQEIMKISCCQQEV